MSTKLQAGGNHLIADWALQNTLEQVAQSVGLFTLSLSTVLIKLLFSAACNQTAPSSTSSQETLNTLRTTLFLRGKSTHRGKSLGIKMQRQEQLVTNTPLGRRHKPCLPKGTPIKWFYKLFNNFYINKRTKTTKWNNCLPTFQVLHITYTKCTICEISQIVCVCVCVCVHFILSFKYHVFNV